MDDPHRGAQAADSEGTVGPGMRFLADLAGQTPAEAAADPSATLARGLSALGARLSQIASDAASGDPEREQRAQRASEQLRRQLDERRAEAPPDAEVAAAAKERLQRRLGSTLSEAVRRLESLRDDLAEPDGGKDSEAT